MQVNLGIYDQMTNLILEERARNSDLTFLIMNLIAVQHLPQEKIYTTWVSEDRTEMEGSFVLCDDSLVHFEVLNASHPDIQQIGEILSFWKDTAIWLIFDSQRKQIPNT